ncbi:hypothetical protein J2S00_000657 [Caldalkalibacillus uzonensis]|uniref:TadE-like domain-containing protein n=1 Tax=Caldalkalibacillus uzonensis TaxID=353224 RepID=A0ABU0CN96_9BACI|nr:TadE family protein [Caldalkalibacillus uzonensis]MDQ0337874.1 hypothetical protein [Caldalkalibacillus uzonensis]
MIKKYLYNERGSQTLEFVALFPLIIFACLFIWQMALAAYTVVVAEAAARDGARVASVVGVGNQGAIREAVNKAAYGLDVQQVNAMTRPNSYGEEVTVTVAVKLLTIKVPFIDELDFTVTRRATMPYEQTDDT